MKSASGKDKAPPYSDAHRPRGSLDNPSELKPDFLFEINQFGFSFHLDADRLQRRRQTVDQALTTDGPVAPIVRLRLYLGDALNETIAALLVLADERSLCLAVDSAEGLDQLAEACRLLKTEVVDASESSEG